MNTPKSCQRCYRDLLPREQRQSEFLCTQCKDHLAAQERINRQSQAIKRAGDRVGGGV